MGLPIHIKQDVIFDYLYIDDLMPIVEYFIKNKPKHSAYNITPDESISLSKIVKMINTVSTSSVLFKIINSGMNFQYTANNTRLIKEIPKMRFTSYDKGILDPDKEVLIQDEFFNRSKIKK